MEKNVTYELFDESKSITEVLKKLGKSENTKNWNEIKMLAKKLYFDVEIYKERRKKFCLFCFSQLKKGQVKFCSSSCSAKYNNTRRIRIKKTKIIPERKKISKIEKLKNEDFINIIKNSKNITEILNKIGYKNTSSILHKKLQDRIKRENVSTSHLTKYTQHFIKYEIDDILVENSKYTNRTQLKKKLIKLKLLEYKCECGNDGWWRNEPMTLQLDHINGKNDDNRITNLRFICPNCHSQTTTFSGRNMNKQ